MEGVRIRGSPMEYYKSIVILMLLLHISILCICQPALSSGPYPLSKGKRKEEASKNTCVQIVNEPEGPAWEEEDICESDVKGNLPYGVPLNLTFRVVDGLVSSQRNACVPIASARIDLWQSRYDGLYSDEAFDGTLGETWLRGYQLTDSSGYASFYSIYPGWYLNRTPHIHIRVRLYNDDDSTSYEATTQLYFDDDISGTIFNDVYPYNIRNYSERNTYNSNDVLFVESNVLPLVGHYRNEDGYNSTLEFILPMAGGEEDHTLTK